MPKITFMGAGSTIFAKNVLGDCIITPALRESHIALHDIDMQRLKDSKNMLDNINKNNGGCAVISAYSHNHSVIDGDPPFAFSPPSYRL